MTLSARAPGKVNLCLFLGPVRADGRHEVVTLLQSVSLADEIAVEPIPGGRDEVVCPGVPGPNLVTQALAGLREHGWDGPSVRVTIAKRIPVAGGMGGGSADAAAVLRIAPALGTISPAEVEELAAALGADVPSQLAPGLALGTGAGEIVSSVEPAGLKTCAFVIVPQELGLSTAEVYREADRLGLPRDEAELAACRVELMAALEAGSFVLGNDLEPAALSLHPELGAALDAVRDSGARSAMVSGSGPTVFGLFTGAGASERADAAAARLSDRYPGTTSAVPVSEEFGALRGS